MTTIWGLLEQRAESHPDDLFAVDEHGGRLSVAEVMKRASGVAGALAADHGIRRDDVVSWQLPNWLDSIVLCLALCRLQVVQNPIVAILGEREVAFICDQARARLLVVPGEHGSFDYRAMAGRISAARPDLATLVVNREAGLPVNDDDPPAARDEPRDTVRWLYYTSGTTSDPKGARHTDATLIAAARGFVDALGISDRDRVSALLPLTHIGGVIHIIASLLTGAPMVVAARFEPEKTIPYLREQGATTIPGAPPFIHAYFAYQKAHPEIDPLFPAARMLTHGGSPKPAGLHSEAKRRLGTVGIVSGYGMTECPMSVWNRPESSDDVLARTEGTAVPGVELRVVAGDGRALPPGQEGEVRVRGEQLMLGYVEPSLDAAAFDDEGFIRSGDLGVLDARGRLTVTGRLKDVIIRNMENISAPELEQLLQPHPKVREVAVIGVPDEITGEIACAVVVPTDPTAPPTLADLCSHLLAGGLSKRKLPERLEVVDSLPRNAMDKVLKNELRRWYSADGATRDTRRAT